MNGARYMCPWRAGCAGTCTSGSEGGGEETDGREAARRLAADPTPAHGRGRRPTGSSRSCRRRYERGSIVLTSNRGFGDWGQVFADQVVASAILDRLLHHATVVNIKGGSYRMRAHVPAGKEADAMLR